MATRDGSTDGYVRIPTSALPSLQLRHLTSDKDFTVAVAGDSPTHPLITGYTEWIGSWQDLSVTVGWDWGVVQGVIVVLNPGEIRTNIMLMSDDCRAEPADMAKIHLLHWIESLPWRQLAIEDLLAQDE